MKRSGNGSVNVIGGEIGTVGSYNDAGGSGSISPAPDEGIPPQELPPIPNPDCTGLPFRGNVNLVGAGGGTTTIDPGVYEYIKVGGSSHLVLNPGMYCITGNGFTGNGGDVDGNGVMFYMIGGDFDLGGNAKVRMYASTNMIVAGTQWAGMLVYMPVENTGMVKLTGSAGSKYRGTIYAPGPRNPSTKPKCVIEGTAGEIGIASQLICFSIKLTGNANINLKYNASQNYSYPASIGLQE
jgi:hypothetical protein